MSNLESTFRIFFEQVEINNFIEFGWMGAIPPEGNLRHSLIRRLITKQKIIQKNHHGRTWIQKINIQFYNKFYSDSRERDLK